MEATIKKSWTEKEIMSLPNNGNKYELVNGELVMGPTGIEHEDIGATLLTALKRFALEHKLGIVCGSSAGYWMKSGNLRSPDVSFIRGDRLKGLKRPPKGFFKGSPDIAVEILSPSDTLESIHGKIVEYFGNETKLAWVINPEEQTVLVYHSPYADKLLTRQDILDGEEVMKGFSFPVAELFLELT